MAQDYQSLEVHLGGFDARNHRDGTYKFQASFRVLFRGEQMGTITVCLPDLPESQAQRDVLAQTLRELMPKLSHQIDSLAEGLER